jgi:hypothetical protein
MGKEMLMRHAPAALAALLLMGASPAPVPSGPQILDVSVLPEPLRVGKPVSIVVHTAPDVTSVQGRVLSFKFAVPKTGVGTFSAQGRVPWFAHLYHGSFEMTFTATDAAGAHSEATATVRI